MGRMLMYIGIIITVSGFLLHFFPSLFQWIGHLPGDIRVERENMTLYIPVTTMILVSLILTVLAHMFR